MRPSDARPPAGSRRWWTVAQIVLLAATAYFVVRAVSGQWDALRDTARDITLRWPWILVSVAGVLCVHALLIQTWRLLLGGWGSALPFGAALRIWTISNLGKYLPGKVWSIGAMGVMSQREGVSGVAAGGAALLNALLNLGAGFGVVALSGAGALDRVGPWIRNTAWICSLLFVMGVALLPRLLPLVLRRIAQWRGVALFEQHVPARTLWIVTALHTLSWVGYGLAFLAFTRGVLPAIAGAPSLFVAVYAASYVLGYLALFAPGGLGVREGAMALLLVALGLASTPDATLLSAASRVWLTVVEVLPGLIALFFMPATAPAAGQRAR